MTAEPVVAEVLGSRSTFSRLKTDRILSVLRGNDAVASVWGPALRFVVTGIFSVGVDVALLVLLHSIVDISLNVATIVAYGAGLLVNYTMNRNWSFQSTHSHARTLTRYALLVAINVATTMGIVVGLTAAGMYYLVAKLLAVALNMCLNFVAGRHWVFGIPSSDAGPLDAQLRVLESLDL